MYKLAQILQCDLKAFFDGIDGTEKKTRPVQVSREDARAAHSLDQIEDPVVRETLRDLIVLLDGWPKDA